MLEKHRKENWTLGKESGRMADFVNRVREACWGRGLRGSRSVANAGVEIYRSSDLSGLSWPQQVFGEWLGGGQLISEIFAGNLAT